MRSRIYELEIRGSSCRITWSASQETPVAPGSGIWQSQHRQNGSIFRADRPAPGQPTHVESCAGHRCQSYQHARRAETMDGFERGWPAPGYVGWGACTAVNPPQRSSCPADGSVAR